MANYNTAYPCSPYLYLPTCYHHYYSQHTCRSWCSPRTQGWLLMCDM